MKACKMTKKQQLLLFIGSFLLHSLVIYLTFFLLCDFLLKITVLCYLSEKDIRVQWKNMTASLLRITAVPIGDIAIYFFLSLFFFLVVILMVVIAFNLERIFMATLDL